MADPIPSPSSTVIVPSNVGATLLNVLVQALTWLAFGFCFGVGFWLSQAVAHKIQG